MIAVLPAAGEGTRLRPITNDLPKVMVKIAGKPLLEYHIENLKKVGVSTFCINLHYFSKVITDYFGDGSRFGIKIHYAYEKKLLGTAGLLNNFRPFLKERFWFVAGDAFLPDFNLRRMQKFHEDKKALITVALKRRYDRLDCDFVEVDKNLRLKKFYFKPHKTKPPTNLDTCTVCLIEPEVLSYLPRRGYFDFTQELLPILVENKLPVFGYITEEFIEDIGTTERYYKVKKQFEK